MKLTALRLLVFKSNVCPHCDDMDRKKVIEKFTAKHYPPKIAVQTLVCLNEDGEPAGAPFEQNFRISDGYGIEAFPTVIIEGKRKDGSAIEIARMDSSTVSAFTRAELDRVFSEGMEAAEALPDDTMTQDEAAKLISW